MEEVRLERVHEERTLEFGNCDQESISDGG